MKYVSLSLLGLTAAIAGLRPANGQTTCEMLLATAADDACSTLDPPTTCSPDGEAQVNLAVCCSEAAQAAATTAQDDAITAQEVADAAKASAQDDADDAKAIAQVPATAAREAADAAEAAAITAQADADVAKASAQDDADVAKANAQAPATEAATLAADAQDDAEAAETAATEAQQAYDDVCTPPTSGWTPAVGQTWNYHLNAAKQLPEVVTPDAQVYMIDMDADDVEDTIAALHFANKYVVCYISIGTWESWRTDLGDFPDAAIGLPLSDWDGEKYFDTTYIDPVTLEPAVYPVMIGRVNKAKTLGCDGIEPDNMDVGYAGPETTGVPVNWEASRNYAAWFRGIVQGEGMKVGLKNMVWDEDEENLKLLAADFDFAIIEECYKYNECRLPREWFIEANKPVFHVEYVEEISGGALRRMCNRKFKTNWERDYKRFSTIIKSYPVWGPYCTCEMGLTANDWNVVTDCASELQTSWD